MGRYPGKATCDVYGLLLDELRPVYLDFGKPAAADPDGIYSAAAASTTDEEELDDTDFESTFDGEMDVPRQVSVVATTGTHTNIGAGDTVTVYGTNIADEPISEVFTFTAALQTALVSDQAFKTVTGAVIGKSGAGVTFDIGWTDVLGLPFKLAAGPFALEKFNGVVELGTAGTFTVDATDLAKNTYDPYGSLNGEKPLQLLLFI